MSTLREFAESAKSLSKNPLGIIALFIVLIYGFAALVVGVSSQLDSSERQPLICMLVTFPFVVLGVFGWLVSQHYEKLYAPQDFQSDAAFLNALRERKGGRPELRKLDRQIEEKVKAVLSSDDLVPINGSTAAFKEKLSQAAVDIASQIRSASFITVDASKLTGSATDVFEFPASAFRTLGELTDEIYFAIAKYVRPFEYGYSWVVIDPNSKEPIKNARMITGARAGIPVSDQRSLDEVGIKAGMLLEVVRPE